MHTSANSMHCKFARTEVQGTECDMPRNTTDMHRRDFASKQFAPHSRPCGSFCETLHVVSTRTHKAGAAQRIRLTTSSRQDRLLTMHHDAKIGQLDGVQFCKSAQNNFWDFRTQTKAMTHGFYMTLAAMQAFPRLCTGGVPATGGCSNGKCLQCAVRKGNMRNPMLPGTVGVPEMSQAAGFLRALPEPHNKLGFDKNWPQQVAEAAKLKHNMEYGGFKSFTQRGHFFTGQQGFDWDIHTGSHGLHACTKSRPTAFRSTGAECCVMQRTRPTPSSCRKQRGCTAQDMHPAIEKKKRHHRVPLLLRGGRILLLACAAVHGHSLYQEPVPPVEHSDHEAVARLGYSQESPRGHQNVLCRVCRLHAGRCVPRACGRRRPS